MSKISIEGNASGTGTFTIASPNSNSNFTLDIPSASGTIDRLNRAGNVLQVVQGSTSTQVAVSSATYGDSGLSASITPSSTNSKILVIVNQVAQYVTASSSQFGNGLLRLIRASTTIFTAEYALYIEAANSSFATSANSGMVTLCYLDSPSTTSSTTYKTQQAAGRSGAVGTMTTQLGSNSSTITLMEIAG